MALQCKTCGGIYEAAQPDGTAYFHACAPLLYSKVRNPDGSSSVVAPGAEAGRLKLDVVPVDRPGMRDENMVTDDLAKPGTIKAAGTGTRVVVP